MELVAHRAGNQPGLVAPALAVADTIEVDVHLFHHRLEVRHSKVIWPFKIYWERGVWLLPDEHPHDLGEIVAAAPDDAHLWLDLKGFTGRLSRRLLREFGDRRPLTMSCRSWWALGPARRAADVRTFRSAANRTQLWLALHLRHPDGIVMHERFATPDNVARLRERCHRLAVWGVDDLDRAGELRELGIDAMIIDDLELIAALSASR
jgi:glycerophosphoryl diester phosphodiesterase